MSALNWIGGTPEFLKHLEDTGVLAEVDAYYDALEAGEDTLAGTGVSIEEVIRQALVIHQAASVANPDREPCPNVDSWGDPCEGFYEIAQSEWRPCPLCDGKKGMPGTVPITKADPESNVKL